jgi:Asp-tRNA(Asn)/Glu-tRNA(Gln) amidotransferase A subunit family amidase
MEACQAARAARSGKLHGLPVGVKYVLDTADMPSDARHQPHQTGGRSFRGPAR